MSASDNCRATLGRTDGSFTYEDLRSTAHPDDSGQVARSDAGRPRRINGVSIEVTARRGADVRGGSGARPSERLRDLDDPAEIA